VIPNQVNPWSKFIPEKLTIPETVKKDLKLPEKLKDLLSVKKHLLNTQKLTFTHPVK
jgi:hypothetical protein